MERAPQETPTPRDPAQRERTPMDAIKSTAPAPPSTREARGLALYLERGSEYVRVSSDTFLVPSCSKHGGEYLEAETCECEDHKRYGGPCKHAFGAMLYRAWIRRAARTMAPVLASGAGGDEDL
jgi:hypothetical protein